MSETLYVSPTELRSAASALDAIGAELLGGAPAPPADGGWAAAEALSALLELVHGGLAGLARRCAETAVALRVAADAYDGADDRAAGRALAVRGSGLPDEPSPAAHGEPAPAAAQDGPAPAAHGEPAPAAHGGRPW